MQVLELKIAGMSCGGCVRHVTRALETAGAEISKVDIGTARVRIDPEKLSSQAVVQALDAAGYPAEVERQVDVGA